MTPAVPRTVLALAAFVALASLAALPAEAATTRGPLVIDSNELLNATASGGDGSAGNPYRLSEYIIAASSGHGIELRGTTAHVNLSGHLVSAGGASYDGVRIVNARNVTLYGSTIEGNRFGVYVSNSRDITIAGNTIKTSQKGVYLDQSTSVSVRDNRISLNSVDVQLKGSSRNNLTRNDLSTSTGQTGLFFEDTFSYDNDIDTSNVVNFIPVRWYTGLTGTSGAPVTISGATVDLRGMTNVAQIMLHNSTNVNLAGAVAKAGSGSGIVVYNSQAVNVTDATAEDNALHGVHAQAGSNVRVWRGSASRNAQLGILLEGSTWSVVESVTIATNGAGGAKSASGAANASIRNSTFSANTPTDVILDGARDYSLVGNALSGAGTTGVLVQSSTGRLDANTIAGKAVGVSFVTSTRNNLTSNVVTLPAAGVGLAFDSVASYDNQIAPTNLVNGTPVRWYTWVNGTTGAPVVLPSLDVQTRGITNVAQIMLYRTTNVTLSSPTARNGLASGIHLYESHDATLTGATASSNTGDGVLSTGGSGLRVTSGSLSSNALAGLRGVTSSGIVVENAVAQLNSGRGLAIDGGNGATLRGNGVTGSGLAGIAVTGVTPAAALVENNLVQGNAGGGVVLTSSNVGSVRGNTISANGGDGLWLSSAAGARVENNNVSNHTRDVRLTSSPGTELYTNTLTRGAGQYGFWFDDEASYNVTLPASNLVNGVGVRWYAYLVGPVTVSDANVGVEGITNVAQVMLYRTQNVTLSGAVAANGSERGIYVFRSPNTTIEGGRAENNTRAGITIEAGADTRVANATVTRNRVNGITSIGGARLVLDRVLAHNNTGAGASVESTAAATVASSTFENNTAAGLAFGATPLPSGSIADSAFRFNVQGISLSGSNVGEIRRNVLHDNGAAGLRIASSSVGNVSDNTLLRHERAFHLSLSAGAIYSGNVVTMNATATGWHFDDETSYDVSATTSNTVNGVPMRWYANLAGTTGAPVQIDAPVAELRGLTNVAQMMLYRSANVTVQGARIANATASGIQLYHSANVAVNGSTVRGSTGAGVTLATSQGAAFRNSTIEQNGGAGIAAAASSGLRVDNSTLRANGGHGVALTSSTDALLTRNVLDENAGRGISVVAGSGANATQNAVTRSRDEGIYFETSPAARLYDNVLSGNGLAGIHLKGPASVTRAEGNLLSNHSKGVQLTTLDAAELHANAVTLANESQTGFWFDGEASYNNVISSTNTVNGTAVRWYYTVIGTESAPQTFTGVRVEQRGITNVAQVMVYKGAYVTLPDVVATNGTARGVFLYQSSSVILDRPNVTNSSLYGVHLVSTQSSTVRDGNAQGSGIGVQITNSHNNVVTRVNASGATTGVVLAETSRDNRVDQIEVNGTARGIRDTTTTALLPGNNLLADAGAAKRTKVNAIYTITDALASYRHDSQRVVSQTWTWGDGLPSSTSNAPTLYQPSHTWPAVGDYRVNYTLTTADGLTLGDSVLVTVVPPLSEPRQLAGVGADRNVTLTWLPPASDGGAPILKYRVYRGVTANDLALVTELGVVLTYVDTGLDNGRQYYYQVAALNAEGEGPRAMIFANPVAVPGAPQNVVALAGPGNVTVNWSAPADTGGLPVLGYALMRSSNATPFMIVVLTNATNYTDGGLVNGYTYTYAVRAYNSAGNGTPSANVTATPRGVPDAPRDLQVMGGDGIATLLWQAPASDGGSPVTGYRLYRGATATDLSPAADLPATPLQHRDTGLANRQVYFYALAAISANGEGPRTAPLQVVPVGLDTLPPLLVSRAPADGAVLRTGAVEIAAQYADNTGVDLAAFLLEVDGARLDVSPTQTAFSYLAAPPFAPGEHTVTLVLKDGSGNTLRETWRFRVLAASEIVPVLSFSNLTLSVNESPPGAPVRVAFSVRNVGYAPADQTVALFDNATRVVEVAVKLAEGEGADLTAEFAAPPAVGVHELKLGDQLVTLTILASNEAPTPTPTAPAPTTEPTPATPEEEGGVKLPGFTAPLALAAVGALALALRRRRQG